MTDKAYFIEMVKHHCLEVRGPDEPPFVLSSGKTSRYYLDLRKLTLWSEGLYYATQRLWDDVAALVKQQNITFDAVGGPCVGADPLVGGLLFQGGLYRANLRGFLVRKDEKSHGKEGRVIGSLRRQDRCLLVEDVVTTGATSLDAINAVGTAGARVVLAAAVVDRQQGARKAFAERGIPFLSLLTAEDLGLSGET